MFIVLHIPFALAMNLSSALSTVHAIVTFLVGAYLALTTREPRKIAWVAAYICGAEILWRMTGANVFWEFGKYAIVALMGLCLMRMRGVKSVILPVVFFGLLCLTIPLTFYDLGLNAARQAVSFNLSGPLCLAVSVIFFTQVRLNWEDREKLIWCAVAPIIGIATLCFWGILTSRNLSFSTDSNFATSGGFGPNQVSAVLGLGALLLVLLAIQQRFLRKRWLPVGLALALLTMSVLTFSRGGLYNFGASTLALLAFSLRTARLRRIVAPIILLAVFFGGVYIYPQLNQFTGGMLATRFSDTEATGRLDIANAEIALWQANPIFGVGPGMSAYYLQNDLGGRIAAHTEYTRMLSEHGIPGILAMLILLVIAIKTFFKTPAGIPQAWMAALMVWPLVEMTHAAMRVAAIGFIFGLAAAPWKFSNRSNEPNKTFESPADR